MRVELTFVCKFLEEDVFVLKHVALGTYGNMKCILYVICILISDFLHENMKRKKMQDMNNIKFLYTRFINSRVVTVLKASSP
jgi:hypothetical protein